MTDTTTKATTPQEVCARIPDHLAAHGWCQQADEDGKGAMCLRGAVSFEATGDPRTQSGALYVNAMSLLRAAVNADPVGWNDTTGRTFEEVCDAARRASELTIGAEWVCQTQADIDACPPGVLIIIDDTWRESSHAELRESSAVGIWRKYEAGVWLPTIATGDLDIAKSGEPLRLRSDRTLEVVPVAERRQKPVRP
jgi:hypothetical protein